VFFIVLLGFAVSQKGDKEGNVSGKSIFGNVPASQDLAEYVVAPIMIVLLALGIYFLNYDTIKANTGLIIAMQSCQGGKPDMQTFKEVFARNSTTANQEAREQLISSCAPSVIGGQYPNQTKLEVFNLANEQLDKQIAETPKDARAYVLGGAFLVSSGQFDKAITMLEKALTLSPKKQSLIVELANAYVNAGKFDKAIEILKPTYEMTPENTQVKQAYAMAMVLNKQEAEARKLFNNDPAIFESDIMARVYMSLKQYDKSLDIYKKKLAADPTSAELMGQLAQAQYTAGRIEDAVKTLESIGEQYPEYADQIQATIKQLRAEATKK
jgi:tetratricopeptide (TPR) repeat protein